MAKMTASELLTRARTQLVIHQPFFASIVLTMPLVEDRTCPTAWTDGARIGYNPDWIETLSVQHVITVLAHEALHIALLHHTRRGGRNPKLWNIAGDYVINGRLIKSGFDMPKAALADAQFEELSTEEVYAAIMQPENSEDADADNGEADDAQQDDKGGAGGGGDEADDAQQDDKGSAGGGSSDEADDAQQAAGSGGGGKKDKKSRKDKKGKKGKSDEGCDADPGGMGEVRDAGRTAAELARAEAETKIRVTQAVTAAKMRGTLPADLERLVSDMMQPQIDWRSYLSTFIRQIVKDDYLWSRPNRRYLQQNIYIPSLYSENVASVCVFLDTSGSVDDRMLSLFLAEFNGVIEQVRPSEVIVLHVDAAVAKVERFTPEDWPIRLVPRGGGGTDFRPPFNWVAANLEQAPACAIYLTDMYGVFPDRPPEYPVLWVTPTKGVTPPWGNVVHIEAR